MTGKSQGKIFLARGKIGKFRILSGTLKISCQRRGSFLQVLMSFVENDCLFTIDENCLLHDWQPWTLNSLKK